MSRADAGNDAGTCAITSVYAFPAGEARPRNEEHSSLPDRKSANAAAQMQKNTTASAVIRLFANNDTPHKGSTTIGKRPVTTIIKPRIHILFAAL